MDALFLAFKITRKLVKNMNIKNVMIFLLIIALLTLCVPDVVAAPAGKQTIDVHNSYAMGASDKERPVIALLLSDNVTAVNRSVGIYGGIATGESGALHYIGGATITIQQLSFNGTEWYNLGTLKTLTGKEVGTFAGSYTPKSKGYHVLRATYDGDNNYAPAVSNMVALIVN
jgi:hypothetical protein